MKNKPIDDHTKNIKALKVLCSKLGVSLPEELQETTPPQDDIDEIIEDLACLQDGEEFNENLTALGLNVEFILNAVFADIEISIEQVTVMPKYKNNCSTFLLDNVCDQDWLYETVREHIFDSKSYKDFDDRLNSVLSKIQEMEDTYSSFDGERDIWEKV